MKYIALLRGINVGGNARVEMARLREVFESMGFINVRTYINSGNVLFEGSHANATDIENQIDSTFGFRVPTLVVEAEQLQRIAAAIPEEWANNQLQRTDVLFLWGDEDDESVLTKIRQAPSIDSLIYTEGAIVWHIDRKNYKKSKLHEFIKNPLYKRMTGRNCNTVRKLLELTKE